METKKYAKFDSQGKLEYSPSILKPSSGGFIINPSEEVLLKEGYLPVREVIPVHDEDGLIVLDKYEVIDGTIVITYKVIDTESSGSDGITPEDIAELEEQIATLTSQNAVLSAKNEELTTANETLTSEMEDEIDRAQTYYELYLDEHNKVFSMEEQVAEWKTRYQDEEVLQEQVAFYQSAAALAHYEEYIDKKDVYDSIIIYGEGEESSDDSNSSDDSDTRFYKSAHIVSKREFVPLKLYRVTDGNDVRWLVYTPPSEAVIIGGIPYPVKEAHGGDWVELKLDNSMLDGNHEVAVYCYMDYEGEVHVGTDVPDNALSKILIARWDILDDSSDSSDSSFSE